MPIPTNACGNCIHYRDLNAGFGWCDTGKGGEVHCSAVRECPRRILFPEPSTQEYDGPEPTVGNRSG